MSITLFQPEVWSAEILSVLAKNLVYAGQPCVNRDYEGEISQYGDTVHIASISDPTIGTYTKDTDITIQALTDADRTLVIDQSKYFAFEVDDIDQRQVRSNGALLAEATKRAGFGLRDVTDQFVAGLMKAGTNATNQIGAVAISTTVTDVYDKLLVPAAQKLDEANVPSDNRWAVLTPAMYAKLRLDGRFIKVNESGGNALHNGNVGDAAGFSLHVSNNAPAGASTGKMFLAGHPIAVSFAEQINQVEAFRMEKRFADGLKGLHLYGSKVLRDTALVSADVTVS